jgi:hypothetical protein
MRSAWSQISEETRQILYQWLDEHPDIMQTERVRGERQMLLQQMRYKFPDLPEGVVQHIEGLTDEQTLSQLARRVLTANHWQEMGLAV